MTSYQDLDATELRAELDEWTQRTMQWGDELSNAIDALDLYRAAFLNHAYKQARLQVRKIRHAMQIGVA